MGALERGPSRAVSARAADASALRRTCEARAGERVELADASEGGAASLCRTELKMQRVGAHHQMARLGSTTFDSNFRPFW